MNEWQSMLRALVTVGKSDDFPLTVYQAHPPSGESWPNLPSSPAIREFFEICDGGYFGEYNWLRLNPDSPDNEWLVPRNAYWHEHLDGYYPDETSPLIAGQHLVLGNDASGSPLIWDRATDSMSTFFFKGGDWEPLATSFEQFLTDLFFPESPDPDDLWCEALVQLTDQSGA